MQEIAYTVRGFLTVRGSSLRKLPAGGAERIAGAPRDKDSGLFTGDLVLDESAVNRTVLGISLLQADVQITPRSRVFGGFDHEGGILATVTVQAVITAARAAGRTLLSGCSCRTASQAVVPLRSRPGFELIKALHDSDVVVVSARGGGGFARLAIGGVSSKVVHHAACPVVIVPAGN